MLCNCFIKISVENLRVDLNNGHDFFEKNAGENHISQKGLKNLNVNSPQNQLIVVKFSVSGKR